MEKQIQTRFETTLVKRELFVYCVTLTKPHSGVGLIWKNRDAYAEAAKLSEVFPCSMEMVLVVG